MLLILAIVATAVAIALVVWGVILVVHGAIIGGIVAIVVGLIIASLFGYRRYHGSRGGGVSGPGPGI